MTSKVGSPLCRTLITSSGQNWSGLEAQQGLGVILAGLSSHPLVSSIPMAQRPSNIQAPSLQDWLLIFCSVALVQKAGPARFGSPPCRILITSSGQWHCDRQGPRKVCKLSLQDSHHIFWSGALGCLRGPEGFGNLLCRTSMASSASFGSPLLVLPSHVLY